MKNNDYVDHLECILCKKKYDKEELDYVCPNHGYEGILDVKYDYEKIKSDWSKKLLEKNKDKTIWRFAPILPINPKDKSIFIPVGNTPLIHAKKLGQEIGLNNLYLKCDNFLPTASLKDRASLIGAALALEKNHKIITAASSGNAAASLAGITANLELQSVLFVPRSAPKAKITQMDIYGSIVFLVDGTYDDAFDLCLKTSDEFGWYSRNTGYNPYLSEGKKTVILEACEQLNWNPPNHIFVPVGDGCIIGSVGKGIHDLQELGWIYNKPKIQGVQSEGASALYNAWKDGTENINPVKTNTLADSISVSLPRDGIKALRSVKNSKGDFIKVTDDKILESISLIARHAGIFAEPAGAAGFAGMMSMLKNGKIDKNEKIKVLVTGSGLKDIKSAQKASSNKVFKIKPDISFLKKKLKCLDMID